MQKKIERERRYILSRPPMSPASRALAITQLYMADGSRLRESTELWPHPGIVSHERIVKASIGSGVATETDVDGATLEEVDAAIRSNRPGLHKLRLVYGPYDGLHWEVDVFSDPVRMVMMEVEVPEDMRPFQQRTLWIRNEGEADAGPLAAGGSGGGDEVEDGDTDDEVDDDADDTDDAGHDDGEAPEDAAGASWTPSGEGDQT